MDPKIITRLILNKSFNTLTTVSNASEFGTLCERPEKILRALAAREGITIQLYSQTRCKDVILGRKKRRVIDKNQERFASLCVVIYGPFKYFEAIGDFISGCGMFLQDPLHCDRNVTYRNPHLMSRPGEEPRTTFSPIAARNATQTVTEIDVRPDLCTLLRSEYPLPETEPPAAVITNLYRYGPVMTKGFFLGHHQRYGTN